MDLLPSVQDKQEKQFIFRHSRSVFELLDADGSNNISAEEFKSFGFLFNFERRAVWQIFREFDVSGDQVNMIYTNGWLSLCMSKKFINCVLIFRSWTTRSSRCLQWHALTGRMRLNKRRGSRAVKGMLPTLVAGAPCCDAG